MMFSPTPTAPQTRLPSVESMRTRVVAAIARCSSRVSWTCSLDIAQGE
jgi:hypothetical protein